MRGKLYCPHAKEYCVKYQTVSGTLKGIQNTWDEVTKGGKCCEWENQQHGRGHHVKIVLSNVAEGSQITLTLVHEDGSKAPSSTMTKHGKRKSTMLIGVDPRDWRLGLSWTHVVNEGPRKWHPASDCIIQVGSPGTTARCTKEPNSGCITLFVPQGKPIIIPIRVEVLSAVKGAGDFSRYSVQCITKPGKESSGSGNKASLKKPCKDVLSWTSPTILVEAKWLPAAPVREQNKRRFNRNNNSLSNNTEKAAENKKAKISLGNECEQPLDVLEESISILRRATVSLNALQNPRQASIDSGNLITKNLPRLDVLVQNLQRAIAEYQSQRIKGSVLIPQYNGSNGFSNKNSTDVGIAANAMYSKYNNIMPASKTLQRSKIHQRKQTTGSKNQKSQHNNHCHKKSILSSPPREVKRPLHTAPRPPLLNLNGNASDIPVNTYLNGINLAWAAVKQSTQNGHSIPRILQSSRGELKTESSFGSVLHPFDLLATAASSKQSIADLKN
mmetsp:Transcript_8156/g.9650  ORF Transcript_8156/g.9650 Transcript_8156/m.9650 type:complete len:500 (-) Transcript_8156:361-1860(-)